MPARTVSYSYDRDFLTAVPGYASAITYHPSGMVSEVQHTNGVQDLWAADPNGMRRPAQIQATNTKNYTFDTGSFAYDGAGNIKAMGLDTFAYDKVSRITSATIGGQPFTYSHDVFGNRLDIETEPFSIDPHTNRYTGNGQGSLIEYDDWGRWTHWSLYHGYYIFDLRELYEYDSVGMVTQHESRSGQWTAEGGVPIDLAETFAYDASDKRMWHERRVPVSGSADLVTVTWRLRDLDGKVIREFQEIDTSNPKDGIVDEWEWVKDTIWREGTLLAARQKGEGFDRHYHTDHLGSLRLVTREGGEHKADFRFGPFGEEVGNVGPGEPRFTGHERDAGGMGSFGDLDYMGARYASPDLGRFLSPDPIESGKVGVPQSWNKYVYALNNPLRMIDRDGLYGRDVHFNLTWYLAVAAGKEAGDALQLAERNQAVDDRTSAFRFWNRGTFGQHFLGTDSAVAAFGSAGNLATRGAALHSVQDSYSHAGFGWPLGHVLAGKNPDQPWRDPGKAMRMARHTYQLLGGSAGELDVQFLKTLFSVRSGSERTDMANEARKRLLGDPAGDLTIHAGSLRDAWDIASYYRDRGYLVYIDGVRYD